MLWVLEVQSMCVTFLLSLRFKVAQRLVKDFIEHGTHNGPLTL